MIERLNVVKAADVILWFLCITLAGHRAYGQTGEMRFIHYTNQDGLPSSYIKDIEQDRFGFVWMANRENVCRFDGYNFSSFPAIDAEGNEFNLRANTLYKALDSLVFCRSIDGDFYYFDYASETFRYYRELNKLGPVQEVIVSSSGEGIWYLLDGELDYLLLTDNDNILSNQTPNQELKSFSGIQLFSVRNGNMALIHTDSAAQLKVVYFQEGNSRSFNAPFPIISIMYLDSNENIWVGNNELGLCRIDTRSGTFEFYSKDQPQNRSLVHNYVHVFEEDQDGILWIGTEGGLCRWNPNEKIFSCSEHSLSNPKGLSSNPIYSALCDRNGNVWLGMYFSGINLWSNQNKFFNTLSSGVGEQYLGGNAVSSFTEDHQGNIWIGLEDMGLNRLDWETGKIKKYPVGMEAGGLSYGNIHDLHFTDASHLWIATYTGGINILNTNTGKLKYINTQNTPDLVSNDIYSFHEVGDTIFIATISGINVYNKPAGKFQPFFDQVFNGILIESITQTKEKIWFSSRIGIYCYDMYTKELLPFQKLSHLDGINFIRRDSKGRLWIGDSYTGLYCYDKVTDEVKRYYSENGFPGTWIYGLQEGANDWYWVSTDKGLVKLDPHSGISFLYNKDSGIPFSQFNYRAAFRDSRGFIYFGSNEGLIYFDEYNQTLSAKANDVVMTGFKLFNQPVAPREDKDRILKKSLTLSDKIELLYKENVFTIEFSALNYVNQGKCHYSYYLDGFENEYNYVGNRNFATYTNLSPGTYTFKVKASLDNSTWDTQPSELTVVVHPPFWLSKWGYALYAVLLVGVLVLISFVSSRIQKSRALAEIERKERVHAVELNQIKLEFFTNISHELRTPLTLIIGPLAKLIADEKVSPFVKEKLSSINLNAHRLLQLLNQLLEFRKIEQGKEELKVSKASISDLFNNLEQSFSMTAEESHLNLNFNCDEATEPVWFDRPKVEKILINLISNSFKFTDAEGSIDVIAELDKKLINKEEKQVLNITIRDTGRGMEPRIINRIFDRFYQSESNGKPDREYYGSGIGLAFVQSLVQLHKGHIRVRSKLNVGTIFKVELPVSQSDYLPEEIVIIDVVETGDKNHILTTKFNKSVELDQPEDFSNKPKILLVEDNLELMEFIAGSLIDQYSIVKAINGKEALDKLSENAVDLILSDVMMPVMDGFEFTTSVKENFETSHIPVILLTAKSGPDNKYEGLKTGADYYIEKPFLAHILQQNIVNVLKTRRNLIKKFKKDAFMPASELTYSDSDKEFIEKLTKIIRDNIDKPDLDVGFLTREIGLSRSMLHIKLKKIADCSATEFINTVRLKQALNLMAEKGCNVSEAAYQTGFSSPTYFTRRFKQYYGQSPRDFLQRELIR